MRTVLLAVLLMLAPGLRADPPAGYPFVSYDEGLEVAQRDERPIFLYFGRYGCGWCEKTNKESFADPKVKAAYLERYVLVYVDAESGNRLRLPSGERITEMELGARMNVFATPVFAWLEPDGSLIFKAPGYKSAQEFLQFDAYVSGGHYKEQELLEFLGEGA